MESALRKTAPTNLEIIETLRFNPEEGFLRLPAHIDRLEKTCSEFSSKSAYKYSPSFVVFRYLTYSS